MVASQRIFPPRRGVASVLIPFIAGQWSLPSSSPLPGTEARVLIPFIAGQWSLHDDVADFCGVAARVLIPFIAGQWSLRAGSARATEVRHLVLIPFIAGQWSLHDDVADFCGVAARVLIPFIAGQWSLLRKGLDATSDEEVSQSPSLRGSGRFPLPHRAGEGTDDCLNPLHCGAVVASGDAEVLIKRLRHVSIPFIAGQWSLPEDPALHGVRLSRLNPLHCGAVVASSPPWTRPRPKSRVSIPFIAGQWSLPSSPLAEGGQRRGVSIPFIAGQWSLPGVVRHPPPTSGESQSPSLRGSGRFRPNDWFDARPGWSLNPLHCGAVVASI